MEVVGEASTGAAAVERILCLCPDIVLMEIALPDANGVDVAAQIMKQQSRVKIIALTMYGEAIYLLPFLQAGGMGYVHKSATDYDLLHAVERVRQDEIFLSEAGSKIVAARYRSLYLAENKETIEMNTSPEDTEITEANDILPDILSEREMQVLRLISHGFNYREIGEKLFLATSTVETYRTRLSEKLQLQKKADLIEYAIKHKLL
jgi:two-component system response regulator NreC